MTNGIKQVIKVLAGPCFSDLVKNNIFVKYGKAKFCITIPVTAAWPVGLYAVLTI